MRSLLIAAALAASVSAQAVEYDVHERYTGGAKIIELTPVEPGTSKHSITDADGCTQVWTNGHWVDMNCPRRTLRMLR